MCFCQTSIFHYDIKFLTLIAANKAWSVRLPRPAKAQTAPQETSALTYCFLSNFSQQQYNNIVPTPLPMLCYIPLAPTCACLGLRLQPPPEMRYPPRNHRLMLKYIHFSGQS